MKKVSADMQTHKNPALKQGGVVPIRGAGSQSGGVQPDKPPVFTREGKKWRIVCKFIISMDPFILELLYRNTKRETTIW